MRKSNSKKIVSLFLTSVLSIFLSSMLFFSWSSADIIDDVFRPSLNRDTVINLWQDKDAVWNRVFKWWIDVVIWSGAEVRDSLLVSISKTLLRITLILWVTMTIRNAIKFVLAAWDSAKQGTAAKHIGYIALGIILALGSVAVIYIITSLSKSIF